MPFTWSFPTVFRKTFSYCGREHAILPAVFILQWKYDKEMATRDAQHAQNCNDSDKRDVTIQCDRLHLAVSSSNFLTFSLKCLRLHKTRHEYQQQRTKQGTPAQQTAANRTPNRSATKPPKRCATLTRCTRTFRTHGAHPRTSMACTTLTGGTCSGESTSGSSNRDTQCRCG
jgi:hypothetical protein